MQNLIKIDSAVVALCMREKTRYHVDFFCLHYPSICLNIIKLEMWANAQRDGRPAEHRAPSIQRRKVWLMPTTTCRAVTLPRRETR